MLSVEKLIDEAREYWRVWIDPPKESHQGGGWVNRWVEATRASPYWSGHVDAFVHPLFAILVVVELARYLT